MSQMKLKAKNLLMRAGLDGLLARWWKLRGVQTEHFTGKTLQERFDRIYQTGVWAPVGSESLSGWGSTLAATTAVRAQLPEILDALEAKSLLDVGCGDFNWMQHIPLSIPYIGIDVVPRVIEANKQNFESALRRFQVADGTREALPAADVVLCREVLFHLSFADSRRLINNIRKTGARYLIATTDPLIELNADIPSGGWREVNLALAPYRLGTPLRTIPDGEQDSHSRMLGIWHLQKSN